jgi:hypothetical protein
MTERQIQWMVALGILTGAGYLVGRQALNEDQKALASQLMVIGAVGTVVGIPVGLWAVPKFAHQPWVAAAILTAASYAVKAAMLPHDTGLPEPVAEHRAEAKLGRVYI